MDDVEQFSNALSMIAKAGAFSISDALEDDKQATEETITETLYVDDKPFETVLRKSSLEDVGMLLYSGSISQVDARHWCYKTGHQLSDIDQSMKNPKTKKKLWPYRLVSFLNKIVDMFVNAFLEDFI